MRMSRKSLRLHAACACATNGGSSHQCGCHRASPTRGVFDRGMIRVTKNTQSSRILRHAAVRQAGRSVARISAGRKRVLYATPVQAPHKRVESELAGAEKARQVWPPLSPRILRKRERRFVFANGVAATQCGARHCRRVRIHSGGGPSLRHGSTSLGRGPRPSRPRCSVVVVRPRRWRRCRSYGGWRRGAGGLSGSGFERRGGGRRVPRVAQPLVSKPRR